jgi:hypothetical protein
MLVQRGEGLSSVSLSPEPPNARFDAGLARAMLTERVRRSLQTPKRTRSLLRLTLRTLSTAHGGPHAFLSVCAAAQSVVSACAGVDAEDVRSAGDALTRMEQEQSSRVALSKPNDEWGDDADHNFAGSIREDDAHSAPPAAQRQPQPQRSEAKYGAGNSAAAESKHSHSAAAGNSAAAGGAGSGQAKPSASAARKPPPSKAEYVDYDPDDEPEPDGLYG